MESDGLVPLRCSGCIILNKYRPDAYLLPVKMTEADPLHWFDALALPVKYPSYVTSQWWITFVLTANC